MRENGRDRSQAGPACAGTRRQAASGRHFQAQNQIVSGALAVDNACHCGKGLLTRRLRVTSAMLRELAMAAICQGSAA